MRAVLLTFAPGVCTAARDVPCLVSPMARETFTNSTNHPLVMPPPLTGTTEQKAATVLNRLQDICAQEYPQLNKDGWIQKHCLLGATSLGKKHRPAVLDHMVAQRMIERENRNGV